MPKPMLAVDWNEDKVTFPVLAQPKIDGVRALILGNRMTGRSLKEHANTYTTAFYSRAEFAGFDGELAAAHEGDPDLCRKTTSAVNTIAGEPYTLWHLFDLVTPDTIALPYMERLLRLRERVQQLQEAGDAFELQTHTGSPATHLRVVPSVIISNMEELIVFDDKCLDAGYEGTIIRNPNGMYKEGRSSKVKCDLWRIKRFIEEEAVVIGIQEGMTNNNEAKLDLLGRTERSTHKENMQPNGMVGALSCRVVKTGETITVSAGSMTHADRLRYFQNPHELIGQVIKYKFFPKGVKDKPRFPTFQTIRAASDIGGE